MNVSAQTASVKDRMELFVIGRTFTKIRQIGSLVCAGLLGWAFMGANTMHILPDTIATVIVGVLLIELFRS
jgi:hypothetical protein